MIIWGSLWVGGSFCSISFYFDQFHSWVELYSKWTHVSTTKRWFKCQTQLGKLLILTKLYLHSRGSTPCTPFQNVEEVNLKRNVRKCKVSNHILVAAICISSTQLTTLNENVYLFFHFEMDVLFVCKNFQSFKIGHWH